MALVCQSKSVCKEGSFNMHRSDGPRSDLVPSGSPKPINASSQQ